MTHDEIDARILRAERRMLAIEETIRELLVAHDADPHVDPWPVLTALLMADTAEEASVVHVPRVDPVDVIADVEPTPAVSVPRTNEASRQRIAEIRALLPSPFTVADVSALYASWGLSHKAAKQLLWRHGTSLGSGLWELRDPDVKEHKGRGKKVLVGKLTKEKAA